MSYWWYGLAVFVHAQVAFLLLALFPFPTTRQWNWILSTTVVQYCSDKFGFDIWNFYIVAIVPCGVLCIDSIRDYVKYSSSELDDFMDQNTRKDRKIQLLFSQRSYYITGAAFILCILVPRILSLRKENGLLCQQIDKLKPVGKGIKQLMRMVNEVQQEQDSDEDGQMNMNNCNPLQRELLQFVLQELQQRKRGDQRRGGDRAQPEPWNAQDMRELIAYYEQLKNQRDQDRANNNDHHAEPNNNPGNQQERLARSRFTSSGTPRSRNIYVQLPQNPRGRGHYGIF